LSGGHAGLLRSIFFAAQQGVAVTAADSVDRLIAKGDVEAECKKIWDSFEEEVHTDLCRISSRENATNEGTQILIKHGLLRLNDAGLPEFTSPVFAKFVHQHKRAAKPDAVPLEFTGTGTQVRVYGDLIANLTYPEYAILKYLADQRPQVCPYAQLIEVMRRAEQMDRSIAAPGNPLRRLEQYVHQIKAKIDSASELIQPVGNAYMMRAW